MSEARLLPKGLRRLPVYTRVTLGGLLLLSLAAAIVLVVDVIQSHFGAVSVDLVTAIIPLGMVRLVWKYGRWALVVAAVLGLLAVLVLSPFYEYGLGNPDSFFDFVPTMVLIFGFVVTFVGGIAAFVRLSRGNLRAVTTRWEKLAFRGLGLAMGVPVIISLVLTITGRDTLADEEKAGATVVRMEHILFQPDWFAIPRGAINKIAIDNRDLVVHTFTIKELDIDITVGPKSEALVKLPDLVPTGDYPYTCEVPGHQEMKGILKVS